MPSKPAVEKASLSMKYEPSTNFKVSKDQAKEVSIGDDVSVTVSGKVVGIRESFDDKKLFDIELRPFNVKGLSKGS